MGSGRLECPNQIEGKLTEALWTSIFLSAIWLFTYLNGKGQIRKLIPGNDVGPTGKSKFREFISGNDGGPYDRSESESKPYPPFSI